MIALFQLIHISIADGYKCVVELGLGSKNKHFFFRLFGLHFRKDLKINRNVFRRLKWIEIEDFNEQILKDMLKQSNE